MSRVTTHPADPDPGNLRILDAMVAPIGDTLRTVGDLGTVAGAAIRQTPSSWTYFSEVLRQAGILVTGSSLLVFFMMFMIGTFCGLEGDAMLTSYGAASYTGVYTAWCGIREAGPIMFGYILAAKVGCGLVAEIGSMTISEEIDALEVMGIPASRFILATRLMAAWLVIPPLFVVGISFEQLANFFVVLVQVGNVSPGTFEHVQFVFQSPLDLIYAVLKGFLEGTAIVLVGVWYGIRARGGPAGVGVATAKSMVLNLVLIHVISGILTRLFWNAYNPNAPIGG